MGFFNEVYKIVCKIPKGKVTTYREIARATGFPKKTVVVGWALHSNPKPGEIPCHRVVNIKGELSGSFAFGGLEVQKSLLEKERVFTEKDGKVNLEKYLWVPGDVDK